MNNYDIISGLLMTEPQRIVCTRILKAYFLTMVIVIIALLLLSYTTLPPQLARS